MREMNESVKNGWKFYVIYIFMSQVFKKKKRESGLKKNQKRYFSLTQPH